MNTPRILVVGDEPALAELVARVKAVSRRRPVGSAVKNVPSETRLTIDPDRWQATLDGTKQELALAFPDDTEGLDRAVDSHIRNIRRRMSLASTWNPIRSEYGVGYAYDG